MENLLERVRSLKAKRHLKGIIVIASLTITQRHVAVVLLMICPFVQKTGYIVVSKKASPRCELQTEDVKKEVSTEIKLSQKCHKRR